MIKFVDMFSGIGGFREGLTRAGGFTCVGHCEIDKYANRSYNALFDTKGEWFIEDARKADPGTMPEFQLLCGGFPCQSFSVAGARRGFSDPRGTLFFEIARLVEARHPAYLILENVPGLLSHSRGETYATILNTLDRLGYGVEWQCLNSKDFGVPQSRNRVYIVGYLDERCRGKVFPFTETTGGSLIQTHGGHQGERVYSPEGLSCTLAANPGGFGGKTGLYEVGVPIKCATKTGYQLAQIGDSIDLSYATVNTRRGRVGKQIAHTLTTGCRQGTLNFIDLNPDPKVTEVARCVKARVGNGIRTHRGESSGVLCEGRIRRLTPRECLRLQGWADDRIDTVLAIQSDNQSLKNVLSIMYSKEDILFAALKVNPARIDSYCQAVDEPILEEIRKLPSGASMDQLKDRWYQGRDGSDYHYHSSRYRACNMHSVFYHGTIEWRLFNSTLHAGEAKANIILAMAISAQGINQKYTQFQKTPIGDNPAFTFRTFLLRLGLIGPEYKNVRIENRENESARAYGRYQNVFLTDEELADLQASFPTVWGQYIEKLSEYMASTGKRYQSHAATIRRWAGEDARKAALPARSRDYSVKEDETV